MLTPTLTLTLELALKATNLQTAACEAKITDHDLYHTPLNGLKATNLQIAAREAKINAMLSLQEKKASLKQKKQAHASISELTEAEANAIEFDDTTGVLGSKTKSNP
jgi:hypothetical protein